MKKRVLTMATLASLIMLNINCQWQTKGSNISVDKTSVNINTSPNYGSLKV